MFHSNLLISLRLLALSVPVSVFRRSRMQAAEEQKQTVIRAENQRATHKRLGVAVGTEIEIHFHKSRIVKGAAPPPLS